MDGSFTENRIIPEPECRPVPEPEKRRILIRIAYDGTAYSGFQAQPSGVKTVCGTIEEALSALTGEKTELTGGSRTDAGVHALDNVAVFDTVSRIPAEKFCLALNRYLPEDIRICSSVQVPGTFHPRKTACNKTYEYRFLSAPVPRPLRRLYTSYTRFPLDTEAMGRAAAYLQGTHDFTSFASIYMQASSPVRTITDVSVRREGEEIVIRVAGTGFLYNMVRIIAGTLLEVGRGRIRPEQMQEILDARDRRMAGQTAPAGGLTLVRYEFSEYAPEI